jgi:hypothetical protein
MTEQPQCKVCFNFMPPKFRDFDLCCACWAARHRAEAHKVHFSQPTYRTPYHSLEATYGPVRD